jgi:hypothetical protein
MINSKSIFSLCGNHATSTGTRKSGNMSTSNIYGSTFTSNYSCWTGGIGGTATNIHKWVDTTGGGGSGKSSISGYNNVTTVQQRSFNSSGTEVNVAIGVASSNATYINGSYYTDSQDNKPPYYDICYFIKVKIV